MVDILNAALHVGATVVTGVTMFALWDESMRYRPYNVVHRRTTAAALAIFTVIIVGAIWL